LHELTSIISAFSISQVNNDGIGSDNVRGARAWTSPLISLNLCIDYLAARDDLQLQLLSQAWTSKPVQGSVEQVATRQLLCHGFELINIPITGDLAASKERCFGCREPYSKVCR
jgi:hypothetical protein